MQENQPTPIKKERYTPSNPLQDYVKSFLPMTIKSQQAEIKYLQSIIRKRMIEMEKIKFKEKIKKL